MTKSLSEMSWGDLVREVRRLRRENRRLARENQELEAKNREYLSKWVSAQDLAYNRMVRAFLSGVDVSETTER